MNIEIIALKLHEFINTQIDKLSEGNQIINFAKPLITRVVNNKATELNKLLALMADKDGEIDIIGMIDEMESNLINTGQFDIHTSVLGDIKVGNGVVKMNIPVIDKEIIFNKADIEELKTIIQR